MSSNYPPIRTPLVIRDGVPQFHIEFDAINNVCSFPDVLGVYGETLVGLLRGGRSIPQLPGGARKVTPEECDFCQELERKGISSNNPRPFGPLEHKVLFVSKPKHRMLDIHPDDLLELYKEAKRIAVAAKARHRDKLDGIAYGMNCGEYALCGETQPHIHSQLAGLLPSSENAADRLGELCATWRQRESRESYLDDYLTALRSKVRVGEDGVPLQEPDRPARTSSLIIDENDDAVLVVPVSQRFRSSMQIIAKDPNIRSLLDMSDEFFKSLATLEHRAITAICLLGHSAFNCTWYTARFSAKKDNDQRFVMNIYPRSGIIALSELLGRYVCDEMPWNSAVAIREALGLPDNA